MSCYCCSTVLAPGTRDHVNYNSIDQEIRIRMLFNSMSCLIRLGGNSLFILISLDFDHSVTKLNMDGNDHQHLNISNG